MCKEHGGVHGQMAPSGHAWFMQLVWEEAQGQVCNLECVGFGGGGDHAVPTLYSVLGLGAAALGMVNND